MVGAAGSGVRGWPFMPWTLDPLGLCSVEGAWTLSGSLHWPWGAWNWGAEPCLEKWRGGPWWGQAGGAELQVGAPPRGTGGAAPDAPVWGRDGTHPAPRSGWGALGCSRHGSAAEWDTSVCQGRGCAGGCTSPEVGGAWGARGLGVDSRAGWAARGGPGWACRECQGSGSAPRGLAHRCGICCYFDLPLPCPLRPLSPSPRPARSRTR